MRQILFALLCVFAVTSLASGQDDAPPRQTDLVRKGLEQATWTEVQSGLGLLRVLTPTGISVSAYRISPEQFEFLVAQQQLETGSTAKQIGEARGAVLTSNGGFFAQSGSGRLYSVGYLRMGGRVFSKGWDRSGGLVSFVDGTIVLTPSHAGIPKGEFDVLQSKPMLIEPGGNWAMGSNSGISKSRTVLCTLKSGDIILMIVSRAGLTLFEAGWLMRSKEQGGFFDCDAAIALDGGRSTQLWHAGEPQYSIVGGTPVNTFFVVLQRDE